MPKQEMTTSAPKGLDTYKELAAMLGCNPEAMQRFEEQYRTKVLETPDGQFGALGLNAKAAADDAKRSAEAPKDNLHAPTLTEEQAQEVLPDLKRRIVNELLAQTVAYDTATGRTRPFALPEDARDNAPVSPEEIYALPEHLRPQLTGKYSIRDVSDDEDGDVVLAMYGMFLHEKDPKMKKIFYQQFRAGLDMTDLTCFTYEMLGQNPTAMGNWLPQVNKAAAVSGDLKIPETTVVKVPMTLLQMSRLDYNRLTQTTREILDDYAVQAFGLDKEKSYFIKTGTFSSKFDFRNAKVSDPKEIGEIGEYLLYLSNQAATMAGPKEIGGASTYGVSTTNEWAVREFIKDKENNPSIYKGLPLHTEYRVFADFDTKEILGMSPYWEPNMMKQRFGEDVMNAVSVLQGNAPQKKGLLTTLKDKLLPSQAAKQPSREEIDRILAADEMRVHSAHDFITYSAHEKTLMQRYEENKNKVRDMVLQLVRDTEDLHGQWSVDIMQNGSDFWLIDMALAEQSAFYTACVPEDKRRRTPEHWIPDSWREAPDTPSLTDSLEPVSNGMTEPVREPETIPQAKPEAAKTTAMQAASDKSRSLEKLNLTETEKPTDETKDPTIEI